MRMGGSNHFLYRIYCAQHIRYLNNADNLCTFGEKLLVFIQQQFPFIVHRNHFDCNSFAGGQQLPGNDVAVMFHYRNNHFITFLHKLISKAGNKQINAFRRPPRKDNLIRSGGIDKPAYRLTGGLMQFCCLLGEIMYPAMHIGIDGIIFIYNRINHQTGLLSRCTVIEINQRLTVYRTAQYRKIFTYLLNIHVHYFLVVTYKWHNPDIYSTRHGNVSLPIDANDLSALPNEWYRSLR